MLQTILYSSESFIFFWDINKRLDVREEFPDGSSDALQWRHIESLFHGIELNR